MNFFDTDNRTIAALDVAAHAQRACRNCAGAHPTQACPEVRQALRAQPVSLPNEAEETRGVVDERDVKIAELEGELRNGNERVILYVDRVEHEIASLRHQLATAHEALGGLRAASNGLAGAVQDYFNKRGVAHAEKDGSEDIYAMAEALAEYGAAESAAARAALGN